MEDKLLFAVDFSPYTEMLLGCAGELAGVGLRKVVLLNVIKAKDYVDYGEEKRPAYIAEKNEAEFRIAGLADGLRELGLEVTWRLISGDPAGVIVEVAREEGAGLIFMGAHGKGFLDRFTVGTVSQDVLRKADRPVLIQHCVEHEGEGGYSCEYACTSLFGNVLVANDFSEYAQRVEPLLEHFSRMICAPTTLLHVQEGKVAGDWEKVDVAREDKAKAEMEKLQLQGHKLSDGCKSIRTEIIKGSPAAAILGYAEEIDASLIVLGAFGQRGIIKGMLGGVTDKVVRGSRRPVMVLKDG